MRSERPNLLEIEVDVIDVGGGSVVLEHGEWRMDMPCTRTMDAWMGARLYKRITLKIEAVER